MMDLEMRVDRDDSIYQEVKCGLRLVWDGCQMPLLLKDWEKTNTFFG